MHNYWLLHYDRSGLDDNRLLHHDGRGLHNDWRDDLHGRIGPYGIDNGRADNSPSDDAGCNRRAA